MARIHQLAVMAAETTNLVELANILVEATNISLKEQITPYTHPVVRFIGYQIAFATDGDLPSPTYYKSILDFCVENLDADEPKGEFPSEPTRQTS